MQVSFLAFGVVLFAFSSFMIRVSSPLILLFMLPLRTPNSRPRSARNQRRYKPTFMDLLDKVDDPNTQPALLDFVLSDKSKTLFSEDRALRRLVDKAENEDFKTLLRTVDGIGAPESKHDFHKILETAKAVLSTVRRVVYCLTAVQILFRPLKPTETRRALAEKCKSVVKGLPTPLQERVKNKSKTTITEVQG